MLQAIRSASGLIAVLFIFIAVGSDTWFATLVSAAIAAFFVVVEIEEAKEMGFINPPQSHGTKKVSLQNQRVSPKSLKL